ncbi:MAG: PAS domain S-box protein [Flavobacterium sp.]
MKLQFFQQHTERNERIYKFPDVMYHPFYSNLIVGAITLSVILLTNSMWGMPGKYSALFPAAAIEFVAIYIFGYRVLYGLSVAIFINSFLRVYELNVGFQMSIIYACMVMFGDWIFLFISTHFTRLFCRNRSLFKDPYTVIVFTVTLAISLIFLTIIVLFGAYFIGIITRDEIYYTAFSFWFGRFNGVVVFAPFLLALFDTKEDRAVSRKMIWEIPVVLAIIVLFSIFAFRTSVQNQVLIIAVSLWIAFRYNLLMVSFASILVSLIATYFTAKGYGVMIGANTHESIMNLQKYLSTRFLFVYIIYSVVLDRSMLVKSISEKSTDLKVRLKELTVIYKISDLCNQSEVSIDQILKECVESLPEGYLYSEKIKCRIQYKDMSFETKGFKRGKWMQHRNFFLFNESIGSVDVAFFDEEKNHTTNPFSIEEERMLDAVKDIFEKMIESRQVQKNFNFQKQMLQATIESPQGIVIFSVDLNYRYLSFNLAHKSMMLFNYGKVIELESSILETITNNESRKELKQRFDLVFEDNVISDILSFENDGKFWEVRINPIKDENKIIIGATFFAIDITEKKNDQDRLVLSEKNYKEIFENVQDVFFKSSVKSKVYLDVSPSCSYFGIAREEMIGRSIYSFFEDQTKLKGFLDELQNTNSIHDYVAKFKVGEKNFYVSIGARILLDENSEAEFIIGSFHDVTDRILAEEHLKISEHKYRNLFERIDDIYLQVDFETDIVMEVSPSIASISGLTPENVRGLNKRTFFVNEEECDYLKDYLLKNGEITDYIIWLKFGDSKLCFSVNSKIEFNENDKPLYTYSTLRNVTERVENMKKIEEYNRKLESQNSELEQFAYITSHDLQEPLITLKYFTDIIKNEFKENCLTEDGIELLNHIGQASNRMQELVKGLLEYSRIGREAEIIELDSDNILKDVMLQMIGLVLKNKVIINVDTLPKVMANRRELSLLFHNLLNNAIKFRRKDVSLEIDIKAEELENEWLFSVHDNGIGIKETNLTKVFTIFKRLNNHEDYEGIGIGLSQCRKIVELFGGRIWVESVFGESTTVYFTFPKIS